MERSLLSLYGLSVISVLVVLILISASVLITNNTVEKSDEISKEVMDSVQDFSDIEHFESSEYSTITVYYSFKDELTTKDPYSVYVKTGEHYYIEVPEINGYSTASKVITGKASGDLSYTVLYTPLEIYE